MIYIGTDEGIYRWFEGSAWPVFHSLQDRSVMALASPGPGVLAALDRGGSVLETTDNGLSWRVIPLPEGAGRPTGLAVTGSPPWVVLAVKPLGLYRRPVGAPVPKAARGRFEGPGLRPLLANTGLDLTRKATALVAPGRVRPAASAQAVRLAGWSEQGAPPAQGAEVRALAAGPGAWLAAVGGAGLWRSGDGGVSWSQCPGLPAEVYAVRPVPGRPGHAWAATADGCRLSTDAGATWEDRSTGLENARHVGAIDVKPDAPDTLLAGAAPRAEAEAPGAAAALEGVNSALYESTNGGKSWTQVRKSFPERLESDTITDIRYDPTAPDNVVVALRSGELWVTRNGGAYWGPLARQTKAARALCATP